MDVILAPDVFVNASVALGSAPEQVARRLLGGPSKVKTSRWVLDRIEAMLDNTPGFKKEAIAPQMATIRSLTEVVDEHPHDPDAWAPALASLAKRAGAKRVLTDHPDLMDQMPLDGIEFLSTEAWLVERQMPPPPPPVHSKLN